MSMLCYELCFALSSIISLIVRILGRDKVRLWVVTRRDATPDEHTLFASDCHLAFPSIVLNPSSACIRSHRDMSERNSEDLAR